MTTPQFLPVAGGSIKLEDLIPTGENCADNVIIQTLNSTGGTIDTYYWDDYSYDTPCWVNGDGEEVKDITFLPGTGLWTYGLNETQGIQSAGKVGKEDIVLKLRFGATGLGNPFPTSVKLEDILPEGEECADNVIIQTLNSTGGTIDTYYWDDYSYDKPCWVNGDGEEVTGVTFEGGEGLWIYGSSEQQTIRFPAPEGL